MMRSRVLKMSSKRRDRPRVALVTNVLAHYRVPCFEALAALLPGQIDFFLLAQDMPHRYYVLATDRAALRLKVLDGISWTRPPFDDLHLNDPRPVLRNYDLVILSGWAEPSYLLLWMLLRGLNRRIGFWIESTLNDASRSSWKELPKRWMLAPARGVIATGTSAADYCAWLGMPRERIFIAPNAVNVKFFQTQERLLVPQRERLRTELNLTGVVILFVGRMVEFYKRVSVLLRAQQKLEEEHLPAELVLVGEGPDRAEYERLCRELNLQHVRFVNFLEHTELSTYYAAADVLVLPSRSETWGLVINEAMEFGLPIVTTTAVGASPDLVPNNENGRVVPPDDVDALAGALTELVRDADLRRHMGERSREIITRYTPEAWAEGFARGLEAMRASPSAA